MEIGGYVLPATRISTRRSAALITIGAVALAALLSLTLTPRAEAFVYWANTGANAIGRANLDGSGADQGFIRTASEPLGLAVDSEHIYWSHVLNFEEPTIGRARLDGTDVDQSFIKANATRGVAVDDAHVYWANVSDLAIGRSNLDGSGVDQGFINFIPGAGSPCGVAVDAEHIYWTSDSVKTIGRANLDGSGADWDLITSGDTPCGVAVDAQHIYWATLNATIGRANLDGSGVEQNFLLSGGAEQRGLAVDGEHIYWADFIDGTIGRAHLDGTDVNESFITGAISPSGLAVDALLSFGFGEATTDTSSGTARLTLNVPGPGALKLAKTKQVKGAKKTAEAKGKAKLSVRPRGKTKKRLNRKGKAKVQAKVSYAPTGEDPDIVANTDSKTVKLVKRR